MAFFLRFLVNSRVFQGFPGSKKNPGFSRVFKDTGNPVKVTGKHLYWNLFFNEVTTNTKEV